MTETRDNSSHHAKPGLGGWFLQQRDAFRLNLLRGRCPPAFRAATRIPPSVRSAWTRQAPSAWPGLPVDDLGWLRCAVGFAQFLEACRLQQAQGPGALPSGAADSVWHVWLAADPAGLAVWQQHHFGRTVEHRDAEDLGAPLEECLARTWVGACRSEGRSPLSDRLPLVFALDGLLKLPGGWAYGHRRGRLVHRQIDAFGQASGTFHEHSSLASAGLVALGLLTAEELVQYRRRQQDSGGDGSAGTWDASDGSDCGSSSSDGGSSCGSSCGSGCGGGD